jgi:Fe-S cluster biogenesis protein NfuA
MEKEIIYILEKIRPYIQNDGGDIEFVKFENGIVYVRMHVACLGCMELDTTMKEGVEALLLEEVPGVIAVEVVE